MPDILTLGEIIVELNRPGVDQPLWQPGSFLGPFPSGAPAIFADAAARLGRPFGLTSGIIGSVGRDDFGRCVLSRLRADGVDLTHVAELDGYTTATAFVAYFSDGSRRFLFHFRHAAAGQIADWQLEEPYLASARRLHIMGSALSINQDWYAACVRAAEIVTAAGGRVSFDPNFRPELTTLDEFRRLAAPVLELADVVLPSAAEAEIVTGSADAEEACRRLAAHGRRLVVLKRGELGAVLFDGSRRIEVPSFPVREVDPTGAGDVFDAAFLASLLHGWSPAEAARFACAAGALSVTKMGAMEGVPEAAQVLHLLHSTP
jgi:sugar/nucleoside kinase (ribokinase family)